MNTHKLHLCPIEPKNEGDIREQASQKSRVNNGQVYPECGQVN